MEYVVESGVLEKCVGNEKNVCIPEGVEQIGFFCFDTLNMKSITIPRSLKQLDHFNFDRYSDLEEINVDSENPNYASIDGVLYNKDKTELLVYPGGAKRTDFTVPDTVLTISERAFSDHKHLKSIDLRHTKVIGSDAFYCCSVEKVIMNDVETIESGAFRWSRLKHLDIPPTLKSIGNDAFDCGIQKSITVPKNVEFVSVDCFANAREISIFDNLRVEGFADYRWKWIERIGKQYRLFVYSADDDSLRYVVPVFPDGTWKMSEALREAWNQEGFFDFQTLDSYFTNVKDFECKIQIALTRIKWSVDLEEKSHDVYMKYLC